MKKETKEFYNTWWFWVLIAFVIAMLIGSFSNNCSIEEQNTIMYCELANAAIEYSNSQAEYINEFANPISEPLETLELMDCGLLE